MSFENNPNGNDVIIQVRNLTAHYGEKRIFNNISFDVYRNEIFVILGPSGCGKTTLLKQMTGLLQPTSGQVIYDGTDIIPLDEDQLAAIQRNIGIAFQAGGLFNSLTVGETWPCRSASTATSKNRCFKPWCA